MTTRVTKGALVQYWAVTPSDTPQPNGNISALWVDTTAGTLVVTAADGSGPFTFTVAKGQWYTFPYAIQTVNAASTAVGIIAAGWGAPSIA